MGAVHWITEQEMEQEKRASRFTWKTDVWNRATPDEAEILDGMLQSADVKLRKLWDDCSRVEHSSNFFLTLYAELSDRFDNDRVDQLLAPSEE